MGGGEEGSHVWRGVGVRRDEVMQYQHSPHGVDTYAGQSKLSSDVKESDSAHYFGLLSVDPVWSNYYTILVLRPL